MWRHGTSGLAHLSGHRSQMPVGWPSLVVQFQPQPQPLCLLLLLPLLLLPLPRVLLLLLFLLLLLLLLHCYWLMLEPLLVLAPARWLSLWPQLLYFPLPPCALAPAAPLFSSWCPHGLSASRLGDDAVCESLSSPNQHEESLAEEGTHHTKHTVTMEHHTHKNETALVVVLLLYHR